MSASAAVTELTMLFDHVLEEHGFGIDHWHSLLWNLHNVRDEDWRALPQGGGRSILELVVHIGDGWLGYDSSVFGDGSREWGDRTIDEVELEYTPEAIETWLRAAHKLLRDNIANLTDGQLGEKRRAPWGEELEIRRLIELQIQTSFYHIGEINHIRALLQGNDDWDHQDMGRDDG